MLVNISGSFFEIGQQRTQMFILSFEPYLNSNYKSESDDRKIFYIISMNLLYKVVLKIDVQAHHLYTVIYKLLSQYSDKLGAPVTSCPSCKRGTTLIILSLTYWAMPLPSFVHLVMASGILSPTLHELP